MEALEADTPQPTQHDRPLLLIAFVGYVSWLFTQTWIPREGIGARLFYAVIGGGLGLGTLLVAFPRGTARPCCCRTWACSRPTAACWRC